MRRGVSTSGGCPRAVLVVEAMKDDHSLAVLAARLCYADYLSVGCHSMVDACSVDYERARRSCVVRLMPAGSLFPFRLCNITYRMRREEGGE